MVHGVFFGVLVLLSVWVASQHARILRLESDVRSLHSETSAPSGAIADSELERRVTALEMRQSPTLRMDKDIGPLPPGGPKRLEPGGDSGDVPAPSKEAIIEALESTDPAVRTRLRAVVEEELASLQEQRFQEMRTHAQDRLVSRIERLSEAAPFDEATIEFLKTHLQSEQQKVMDLFSSAQRDMSFPEARQKADALRDETDALVKSKLNEEQFSAYSQMRVDEAAAWRGWGRRGRDRARESPR